ncbi:MAG TPA: type II toxin-antitoxin system Phd/YefM family antitoxin [Pseudoduganella sp.]|jgi:prevent-host-death family protein
MAAAEQIKPISYLKSNTTDIVNSFDAGQEEPIIITQNGEAKMVVMSIEAYRESKRRVERIEEQHAFMKLVALGNKEIAAGGIVTEEEFLADLYRD